MDYEILWEREYKNGYANCRVAVDSKDNILVCGIDRNYRGMVLKYDKNGNLLWVDHTLPRIYKKDLFNHKNLKSCIAGEIESSFGGFLDIDINENDEIAVVGSFYKSSGEKCIVYIKKYDSNGKKLWDKRFSLFQYNQSTGIKFDNRGNIFIVGYGGNLRPPILRGFIAKFSPDGKILWWNKLGKIGRIFTGYTTLDIGNYIYVAGITAGIKEYNLILAKFRERWKIKDKIISGKILPGKLIMDKEGNLIVVGQKENGGYRHYIAKFSPQFDIIWEKEGIDGGLYDACMIKYGTATTGKIMENKYYAAIYGNRGEKLLDIFLGNLISNGKDVNDWMRGIAVDSMNNVIVAGGAPMPKLFKVMIKEHMEYPERRKIVKKHTKSFFDFIIRFLRRLFG